MRPVVLAVLDGFGIGPGEDPTAGVDTPFFDRARRLYPHASLEASGTAVGIPDGLMGNSEVGHMTLGAGRIIDQDIVRIQKALDEGELERNEVFTRLLRIAADGPGRLHLLGLVSDGRVHSSFEHLEAILEVVDRRGLAPILHAFTDGRDTPPRSALQWLVPLEKRLAAMGGGIATVSGRYYAMDRDQRWDRIDRAYRAVAERDGIEVATALEAVEKGYGRDEGDEFIQPSVVGTTPGLSDGEVALFFNFRADRARELTNMITRERPELLGPEGEALPRIRLAALATWTAYDARFHLPTVFPPIEVSACLGEVLSRRGLKQLRIAETEKYAHVTYFFSGGREKPFSGEDRILVPSARDVATYDLKPEMSAVEVTDRLIEALEHEDYAFVLVNYANPDMVGHTGIRAAAVRAIEVVDACLDRVCQAVLARGGTLLITSDHGNVERMIDPETGSPHTAHTTNRVPILWVVDPPTGTVQDGGLADVAPSLCLLLNLEVPVEMTGRCLISDPSS